MQEWTGIIEIGIVGNRQVTENGDSLQMIFMNESNVKFVHYPDCQQLIIWLPQPGTEYNTVQLYEKHTRTIQQHWPVSHFLNGSIQLLWDTLFLEPGDYHLEINWKQGGQHSIDFIKREAGFQPAPKPLVAMPEYHHSPIVYRDGFGKVIEEQDRHLQQKLMKDVTNRFARHLEYTGSFRGGTIIYIDGDVQIKFSHEMGGGDCMFFIDIPEMDQWQKLTKTSLEQRPEIIAYVADTVKRDQAPGCRYEIGDSSIIYYYR